MNPEEPTLTDKWLAELQAERDAAIKAGRYFDGQERDNILCFKKRRALVSGRSTVWDDLPSDCNPD
ncbi:MAG: hypothetical protein ACK4VI_06405 [Alphaproteobacteria bacterium]